MAGPKNIQHNAIEKKETTYLPPFKHCIKAYLVLTDAEKSCAVWTEVNVINLFLVRGKVVHLNMKFDSAR